MNGYFGLTKRALNPITCRKDRHQLASPAWLHQHIDVCSDTVLAQVLELDGEALDRDRPDVPARGSIPTVLGAAGTRM